MRILIAEDEILLARGKEKAMADSNIKLLHKQGLKISIESRKAILQKNIDNAPAIYYTFTCTYENSR